MAVDRLNNVIKNRIITELKLLLENHPRFNKVLVTNKYPDLERAKDAIYMKGASADPVILSADHHIGHSFSHVFLAHAQDPVSGKVYPGFLLQWIREDPKTVSAGKLVPPGFYYLTVGDVSADRTQATLFIDPLLRVDYEILISNAVGYETKATLQRHPIQDTSLEVFDATRFPRLKLVAGMHYNYDNNTGIVTFTGPVGKGATVEASYRYPGESVGPIPITPLSSNNLSLPGVVLAFGEYFIKGDKVIIAVTQSREIAADIKGGRWQFSYSMDVLSQDPIENSKISDFVMQSLWSRIRDRLSDEGIMIENVTHSGESENPEYEEAQDFYYATSVDVVVNAEWEEQIPELKYIKKVSLYSPPSTPDMTDEEVAMLNNSSLHAVIKLPVIPAQFTCERLI